MPDDLCELPGEVDACDIGSALATEPTLRAFVALLVVGVAKGMDRSLDEGYVEAGADVTIGDDNELCAVEQPE